MITVEHLQNFHALLHTHRNITDERIRVYAQTVFFGKFHNLLAGNFLLQETGLAGFHTQHDVIQHAEAFHQFEMLVNHADAQIVGHVGVLDVDLFAVLFDDALFRLIQTKQYAHQRGFARAVFAQKGVDFAPAQLQSHIIIGLDAREFLGDVKHLNYEILCQSAHAPFKNCFLCSLYNYL